MMLATSSGQWGALNVVDVLWAGQQRRRREACNEQQHECQVLWCGQPNMGAMGT
jgi:hypothetical protein